MVADYSKLYERELNRLLTEIQNYTTDAALWKVEKGISNSGGNLILHLCGNLKHFIGAQIGNTGFVREREAEFSTKDVSREELKELVRETTSAVLEVINAMEEADLTKPFPLQPFGYEMTNEYMLIHLLGHLNYHLGQINYHRRLG